MAEHGEFNRKGAVLALAIAATAAGMSPATVADVEWLLKVLVAESSGLPITATDADIAGRRYAVRLAEMATEAGVPFDPILPPGGLNDWNDALGALAP